MPSPRPGDLIGRESHARWSARREVDYDEPPRCPLCSEVEEQCYCDDDKNFWEGKEE